MILILILLHRSDSDSSSSAPSTPLSRRSHPRCNSCPLTARHLSFCSPFPSSCRSPRPFPNPSFPLPSPLPGILFASSSLGSCNLTQQLEGDCDDQRDASLNASLSVEVPSGSTSHSSSSSCSSSVSFSSACSAHSSSLSSPSSSLEMPSPATEVHVSAEVCPLLLCCVVLGLSLTVFCCVVPFGYCFLAA